MIALPWIALSWFYERYANWARLEPDSTFSTGNLDQITARTFGLTAATLLLYGGYSLVRANQLSGSGLDIRIPNFDLSMVATAFSQLCSVALPIYATLKVGGFLFAFALVIAVGSGLPALIRGHASGNGKQRASFKKVTAALLLMTVLLNFLGMNAVWGSRPFFGYLALLASVFLIRPPFTAGSTPNSASGAGLGISFPSGSSDPAQILLKPDDSSRDPAIAALSGLTLGLLTFLFTKNLSFGASDVVYILTVSGSLAASLTYLDLSVIHSPRKLGVAIATGSVALFCSPPVQDDIYIVYVVRIFLAVASFFATKFDVQRSNTDNHAHHHHHAKISEPSRATKLILHYSEPYPLLYSILRERDSRRIFYFMRFAAFLSNDAESD